MKVGFIGLGLMGKPMALNINKKGFPLTVYNRTPSRTEEFKTLPGAKVALSPAGVGEESEVVVTMVTGPEDVNEVIFGDQGLVKTLQPGSVIIDMSTIGPTAAREVAGRW